MIFINDHKKLFYSILSDLSLLAIFIIFHIFSHIIIDYSLGAYYCISFILFLFATLSLYQKLYSWRNLDQSVSSFIFFSINLIQLFLYLFSISYLLFNILYSKQSFSIYLQDISVLSQYRYLALFTISFLFIIIFSILRITGYSFPFASFFTYPYLKEEVRYFLYSWNDSFMGDLSIKLIDKLYFSFWSRISFFILHGYSAQVYYFIVLSIMGIFIILSI